MCETTTETVPAGLTLTAANDSTCGCGSAAAKQVPATDGARYDLQGLTCGSCVRKVETLVGALPGVESATVELVAGGTSTLTVAGAIAPETVTAAVIAAGYGASAL
jgi:copper chaperone